MDNFKWLEREQLLFIAAIQWTLLKIFFQPSPSLDPFLLMSSINLFFRSKDKNIFLFC